MHLFIYASFSPIIFQFLYFAIFEVLTVMTVLESHVCWVIMFLFFSRSCESIGQLSLLLYPSKIKSKLNDKKQMSPIQNPNQRMTTTSSTKLISIKQEERNWHLQLCLIPGHVQLALLTSLLARFSWIKKKIQPIMTRECL